MRNDFTRRRSEARPSSGPSRGLQRRPASPNRDPPAPRRRRPQRGTAAPRRSGPLPAAPPLPPLRPRARPTAAAATDPGRSRGPRRPALVDPLRAGRPPRPASGSWDVSGPSPRTDASGRSTSAFERRQTPPAASPPGDARAPPAPRRLPAGTAAVGSTVAPPRLDPLGQAGPTTFTGASCFLRRRPAPRSRLVDPRHLTRGTRWRSSPRWFFSSRRSVGPRRRALRGRRRLPRSPRSLPKARARRPSRSRFAAPRTPAFNVFAAPGRATWVFPPATDTSFFGTVWIMGATGFLPARRSSATAPPVPFRGGPSCSSTRADGSAGRTATADRRATTRSRVVNPTFQNLDRPSRSRPAAPVAPAGRAPRRPPGVYTDHSRDDSVPRLPCGSSERTSFPAPSVDLKDQATGTIVDDAPPVRSARARSGGTLRYTR